MTARCNSPIYGMANTQEPAQFRAGESVTWTKSLSDYSASDGWTLKYSLSGSAGSIASKAATGSGNTFTMTYTTAETAALGKGTYKLFGWVESGTTKIVVSTTTVTVLENLFTAATTDQRSDNQIILDAIIAVIKGRATKQHTEIAIAGRNIMLLSLEELHAAQKKYELEVREEKERERIANGGTRRRNLMKFPSIT